MTVNVATRYAECKRFATSPVWWPSSELLQAGKMDTNYEIRLRRLEQLCEREGGIRAVAEKAEMNWQALDQVLKRVLLPPKADKTRSPRALGDDAARKLEETFDLGEGWFDWPFEGVDFKKWAALDPFQRAYVQGQLNSIIAQAAKTKMPAAVKRQAVSNKKVEQHYKALPSGAAEAAYRRASTVAEIRRKNPAEPELPFGRPKGE